MNADTESMKQFKESQEFVVAEFNYIAQTAYQANEDRARVSEFFLISFGTFLAAFFSSEIISEPQTANIVFSIIFFIVAFLGATTILELSHLRLAWLSSVLAMNKMKNFVFSGEPGDQSCIIWRIEDIPESYKPWSVGFLKALQVSVLSGVAFGASALFLTFLCGKEGWAWYVGIVSAIIIAFLYMVLFYYRPLQHADITETIKKLKNE